MTRARWIVALALAGSIARADSLSSLPDPGYADVKGAQQNPITPHVTRIVYPVVGAPALVAWGEGFDVWIRGLPPEATASPLAWKAILSTEPTREEGPWAELTPTRIDRDPQTGLAKLRIEVPPSVPREVYHLRVLGPGAFVDGQPHAVRVLGPPRDPSAPFRIAVMSDHQLWDPSWEIGTNERNGGDYPRRGETQRNRAAARQGWHELEAIDPDFVLYGGDLVFGLDYPAETAEMWRLWSQNRFASFLVPGNHDGYSRYEVRPKAGLIALGAGMLRCRGFLDGPLDREKVWQFIACAYQGVQKNLWEHLLEDGLAYYRAIFGPPFYSFDAGALHVIALNTYSGTPERRHSYSFYVDLFDLHLGAPAVDNYGGYLTDAELEWLEGDAKAAAEAGKTVLVFGHHDPRGNREAAANRRFHHDNPFPTDPISLEGFQEWNYDSPSWDSDPKDARRAETPLEHSGTRLLRILARYATYVLLGHRHADERMVYQPGDEIALGVRAERRMEFVRVTSAASSTHGGSYWGYRLLTVSGGAVDAGEFDPAHGLASVPEGNLWIEAGGPSAAGAAVQTVVSALPKPMRVTLRYRLREEPLGYRFTDASSGRDLAVDAVARLPGGRAIYAVGYEAPASDVWPPRPGGAARHVVSAQPALENHAPVASIDLQPDPPVAGQECALSAERTADPDGDPLIERRWDLGGAGLREGATTRATWTAPGTYLVQLDVTDAHGARGHAERAVTVAAPPLPPAIASAVVPPAKRGCQCTVGARAGRIRWGWALTAVAAWVARRRRKVVNQCVN